MKSWKVIIEFKGKILEVIMQARTYSEAYLQTEHEYAGCKIRSITVAHDSSKK